MPLTTVARGRVFDWSHAVGRNAARGNGFNYIQSMCLDNNSVLYAANRGTEGQNKAMHVNKTKLGGPGEEEWLADFFEYGDEDALIAFGDVSGKGGAAALYATALGMGVTRSATG